MGYSKEEQETSLVFDYVEGVWMAYSTVPKHIRKLESLCELTVLESENDRPIAVKGILKEKQVSMKNLRVFSDEQKQAMSERMKNVRNNQEK